MNTVSLLFAAMREQMGAIRYPVSGAPRGRTDGPIKKLATQKGAVHKVNPTFRSKRLLTITPAQFRRQHLGASEAAKKRQFRWEARWEARNGS